MEYKYNGHLLEIERIKRVAKEIREDYPYIETAKSELIAALENPITTTQTIEMEFNRLFNILFVTHNDKKIYSKVFKDLCNVYNQYLYQNNSNDNKIDRIMEEVLNYNSKKRLDFPIISEFYYWY